MIVLLPVMPIILYAIKSSSVQQDTIKSGQVLYSKQGLILHNVLKSENLSKTNIEKNSDDITP